MQEVVFPFWMGAGAGFGGNIVVSILGTGHIATVFILRQHYNHYSAGHRCGFRCQRKHDGRTESLDHPYKHSSSGLPIDSPPCRLACVARHTAWRDPRRRPSTSPGGSLLDDANESHWPSDPKAEPTHKRAELLRHRTPRWQNLRHSLVLLPILLLSLSWESDAHRWSKGCYNRLVHSCPAGRADVAYSETDDDHGRSVAEMAPLAVRLKRSPADASSPQFLLQPEHQHRHPPRAK